MSNEPAVKIVVPGGSPAPLHPTMTFSRAASSRPTPA
jgi:hypothetical protein